MKFKNRISLFLLLIVSYFPLSAQDNSIESLIEFTYKNIAQPSSKDLLEKILDLEMAKDTIKQQEVLKIRSYQCLFDYYYVKKDFQNAIRNSIALQYFIKTKAPDKLQALSEIYYKTGVLYATNQNRLKSIEYYQKGVTEIGKQAMSDYWCKNLNAYINTSIALNRINGDLVNHLNDFSNLCTKESDFESLGTNYSQLAFAFSKSNKINDALAYHKKAFDAYQKSGNKTSSAAALNNIGYLLRKNAKYQESIEPLNNANTILKSINLEWIEIYNNLAVNYAYMNKFLEAEILFIKALSINKNKNNTKGIAESYNYLALSSMLQNNSKDARDYINRAIEISTREDYKDVLAESYLILSKLEAKESNYKASQEYESKYNKIIAQLNESESERNKREQEINYESEKDEKRILNEINEKDKRELELAQLRLMAEKIKQERESEVKQQILLKEKTEQSLLAARRQIEIQNKNLQVARLEQEKQKQATEFAEREKESIKQQKDRELKSLKEKNKLEAQARIEKFESQQSKTRQKFFLIGLILVFTLLLMALFAFFRNRKQKRVIEISNKKLQNSNDEIVIQKNIIENKNEQITDSINYAQTIQSSILPQEKQLKELFKEVMMIYMPREKVSGDFPWVFTKDNAIYIGAVDCTGHGVPGALLSVIGHFVLNESIQKPQVTNPGLLLDYLHHGVKHTLKQEENIETRDGMDVAMCKFDLKNRVLDYAGAHRPMYHLRKGQLTEYKGTRRPIGGIKYNDTVGFKNESIVLEEGDIIYFFTDGYPDQIGGEKRKKFLNYGVQNMILEHFNLPLNEQKSMFVDIFNQFKGDNKQIDDVLFMAVKI